jgi:hypothetical protein
MVSSKQVTLGFSLSEMISLWCFQIHHVVSMMSEEVPLHNTYWVEGWTSCHHYKWSDTDIDLIHKVLSYSDLKD